MQVKSNKKVHLYISCRQVHSTIFTTDITEALCDSVIFFFFPFYWTSNIKLLGHVREITTLEQQDESRKEESKNNLLRVKNALDDVLECAPLWWPLNAVAAFPPPWWPPWWLAGVELGRGKSRTLRWTSYLDRQLQRLEGN